MLKTSRSAIETYWRCPRLRLLTTHWDGLGIVPAKKEEALELGDLVHQGLAHLIMFDDIDTTLFEAESSEDLPMVTLAEVLVRIWQKVRLPYIRQNYEVVAVEEEIETQISSSSPDIVLMSRLDGILRSKLTGELGWLEHKTTSIKPNNKDFIQSWHSDMQGCSHNFVVEKTWGWPCGFGLYEFFYKGYRKSGNYYSPLIRGCYNEVSGAVDFRQQRGSTWKPAYIWEPELADSRVPNGWTPAQWWVNSVLDMDVMIDQLGSLEVHRTPDQVDEWLQQTLSQEQRIATVLENLPQDDWLEAPTFAQQKGRHCAYGPYRKPCPMHDICFGLVDLEGAVASGDYVERTPHHDGEVEDEEDAA